MCEVVRLEDVKYRPHLIRSAVPILQLQLTSLHAMNKLFLVHRSEPTVTRCTDANRVYRNVVEYQAVDSLI